MDEALAKMVHIKDVFMPDMENHALYAKLYREVFTHIFAKLQPLYSKLGHIMEGLILSCDVGQKRLSLLSYTLRDLTVPL